MIGTNLGPYRLEKELGNGGMGSVYLATTLEDAAGVKAGENVAVKVVHPHLLESRGFFKRFMREADIGKSVRHESVVRTLDVDAEIAEGKMVHYMVMEYVEGRTLRELLEDLKTVPETLLREIARQVSGGLTAIHAAGIVHRDLKPENVLITPDHDVKVMDLGVARLMEQSVALTREGQFAGSLLYAAPEQFGNAEVGPLADLYSVGVMLYELASGSNPFQRDGAVAVMGAHLKEAPPRLSEHASEVSPFFGELVGTLLHKDPAERVESATALHALLEEGEASTWWGEREKVILKEEGHLPKIPVRRETTLHGRDQVLSSLKEAWDAARTGKGGMVLIEGEAGIGKTRVVDAFLQTLKGQDAHVLYGAYPPSGGMGGMTDALTARFGTAGMQDALAPYMTVTPRLVPGFTALVQHQAPPEGAEPLTHDAMHACFVHVMKALAAEKPLLWIVDDLQFAQPDSRKVLLSLARAVDGHRALLLATTRPGLPEDEVANLSRLPTLSRITLGRLSPREVIRLLQDAFRSAILAERLGGKIAMKSDGVPYFVFEMIRGLKEGNFISQGPDGTYVETQVVSDIEVPSAVRDLIEARLKDLTRDERALLDVGAVQGMDFDPDLLSRVLEIRKMRVLQDLAEIERRSGVVRASGMTYKFDQNQIQEVLHKGLSDGLRSEYHAALAEAFAEREGVAGKDPKEVPGSAAVFLASHHLRGSRPRAGVAYLVPAAANLRKAYRDEEALELLERGLGATGLLTGTDRMEALLLAGPLLQVSGRPDEGTAALEEAVALADAAGDPLPRARARRALAGHLSALGRFAPALDVVEAALQWVTEAEGADEKMGLERIACGCLHRLGRLPEVRRRLESVLDHARTIGNVDEEANAALALGGVLTTSGHYGEARLHKERALDLTGRGGNRRMEATQTCSLAEDDRADGSFGVARDGYLGSMLLARETGHRTLESICQHNLGETLIVLGDLAGARERLDAAESVEVEVGSRWLLGYTMRARADRAMVLGEGAEAAALYEEALSIAREVRYAAIEAEALVGLGRLHAQQAGAEEATTRLSEALEVARRADDPNDIALATCIAAALPAGDAEGAAKTLIELGDRPWHTARMECRWWLWKATQDTAHLAESWRLLQYLRDHAPEEYRETMMTNVPLHRDIAAAAQGAGL